MKINNKMLNLKYKKFQHIMPIVPQILKFFGLNPLRSKFIAPPL